MSDVHLCDENGGVIIYNYKKKKKKKQGQDVCLKDRMVGSVAVSDIFPRSYPFRIRDLVQVQASSL